MKRLLSLFFVCFVSVLFQSMAFSDPVKPNATKLYKTYCNVCHGDNRLGGMGPALLPQNLKRLRQPAAKGVIENGRDATQMPGFSDRLSSAEIQSLTEWIYSEPTVDPEWSERDIRQSHIIHYPDGELGDKPVFSADLQNLFIVVELGDHHATVLDGDTFEPIHRFQTRFAVHGGPKYTQDGRYVFFASRDGWVSKFDMYNLKTVAEVRAGINTRNAAVSYDGQYVAVGNYLPNNLVILSAKDLSFVTEIKTESIEGKKSRVSAVYTAPPRNSFIVAMKDATEIWELPYTAGDGQFTPRKIKTDGYLDDFFFDPEYKHVIGSARNDTGQPSGGQVIDLDTGKKVANLDLAGMPHLGSGITWLRGKDRLLATPNLKDGVLSIIDMNSWETIDRIKTNGPGFFMRSHANSPYAWVDVFFGPNKDQVHVIDKQSLKIVKTIIPDPGKTAAHVEFTKNGSHALLSVWDVEGAIVVYDAVTLKEVKRVPMNKPSGKYNVYNKTHYEEGTSH